MKTNFTIFLFLVIFNCFAQPVLHLFNGKDLKGWYIFLEKRGVGKDPEKVFQVQNGELRISGKENGYLSTDKSYENYKLMVEFRWGEATYSQQVNYKKDSGILYHTIGPNKLWPYSIEFQIQEGDCGDFWLLDGLKMNSKRLSNAKMGYIHIPKSTNAELPTGEWNIVEIISNKGKCTHIVNGMVVNEGTEPSSKSGRILLQSEGAEIFFKKIELTKL